jgi:hypothetical protein
MKLLMLACIFFAACSHFSRYNAGTVELWIGDQQSVQAECVRRGTTWIGRPILGCTDFLTSTIVSVKDPKIIAHEVCHWTRGDAGHTTCGR